MQSKSFFRRALTSAVSILLLGMSLTACTPGHITVQDYRGQDIVFDKPPERVAVLSSPLVSVLDELGVNIVASNTLKDFVKADLKHNSDITDVGSAVFPDIDAIKASDPDVVIAGSAFGKLTEDITAAGMTLWMVDNQTYGQLLARIDQFGDAFGKQKEAKALSESLETRRLAVMDKLADRVKPNVLVLWGTNDGLMVAADNSFACDALKRMGCYNLQNDIELEPEIMRFMYVMDEDIVSKLNPDVIIRIYDGDVDKVKVHFDQNDTALATGSWSHMTAARNGRVYTLPEDGFAANPGVTMMDSFETLAALITST